MIYEQAEEAIDYMLSALLGLTVYLAQREYRALQKVEQRCFEADMAACQDLQPRSRTSPQSMFGALNVNSLRRYYTSLGNKS